MEAAVLLQFIFAGLTLGVIYGITGIGFSIIYNSTGAINFAQGEFLVLGAFITISLDKAGVPLFFSVALSFLILFISFGAVYFLFLKRAARDPILLVVATIGLSLVLKSALLYFWGREPLGLRDFFGGKSVSFYGVSTGFQNIFILVISCLIFLLLLIFFNRSFAGKAMKAVVEEPELARIAGISPVKYQMLSFSLAAGLAAFAGSIVAPVAMLSFGAGSLLGLKGFAAAIAGGLSKPEYAIPGGLIIGIVESLSVMLIPSGLKDVSALIFLLLILALKPEGLFIRGGRRKA